MIHFTLDNTKGFTQLELDMMNIDFDRKHQDYVRPINPDEYSDLWDEFLKMTTLEKEHWKAKDDLRYLASDHKRSIINYKLCKNLLERLIKDTGKEIKPFVEHRTNYRSNV